MSTNRAAIALARAYIAALPPAISAAINAGHVHQAMAQAQPNGWTAAELLSVSVNDTRGLAPGPAAAKVLAQLRNAAETPGPNKTSAPPSIAQVRADMHTGHQASTKPSQWAERIRKQLHGRTTA